MAKRLAIGSTIPVYKKRITRPGRHSKKPNKRYAVKTHFG